MAWATASAVAGALTWAAYRGPPPRPAVDIPSPISRKATPQEVAQVRQQAVRMTAQIQETYKAAGEYPTLSSLEGNPESGHQWLSSPIPDNPLVEGVATVGTSCSEGEVNGMERDWWYCPQTGQIRPGGLQRE